MFINQQLHKYDYHHQNTVKTDKTCTDFSPKQSRSHYISTFQIKIISPIYMNFQTHKHIHTHIYIIYIEYMGMKTYHIYCKSE